MYQNILNHEFQDLMRDPDSVVLDVTNAGGNQDWIYPWHIYFYRLSMASLSRKNYKRLTGPKSTWFTAVAVSARVKLVKSLMNLDSAVRFITWPREWPSGTET